MKVFTLKEGVFSVGKSKVFEPFDKQVDQLSSRERGSFLLAVQPFLVVMNKEVIVVDTGLGHHNGSKLQLVENIENAGYRADQVTRVLLSHLHRDHVGGIFSSADTDAALTFPNAIYYLQQRELDTVLTRQQQSCDIDILNKIKGASQFCFLLQDTGEIAEGIRFAVTGGHSPYHQVFWFTEGDELFFYGGDVAPQLFFVTHKIWGKYDFDGKKTRDWRANFLERAVAENWTFLFYHDTDFPMWNPNRVSI